MTSSDYAVGDRVEWDSYMGPSYEVVYGTIVEIGAYAVMNLEEEYGFGWGHNPSSPNGKWAVEYAYIRPAHTSSNIVEPDESIYNDLI